MHQAFLTVKYFTFCTAVLLHISSLFLWCSKVRIHSIKNPGLGEGEKKERAGAKEAWTLFYSPPPGICLHWLVVQLSSANLWSAVFGAEDLANYTHVGELNFGFSLIGSCGLRTEYTTVVGTVVYHWYHSMCTVGTIHQISGSLFSVWFHLERIKIMCFETDE